MAIHYKFVNELELSHVMLDGDVSISASDLKRAVVRDRKLGRVTHFDLVVRNEADLEADFFERNTTVTVARVPLVGTKVKTWWEEVIVAATSKESRSTSEEKHIDEIIRQSAEMYAPKNWLNKSKKSMVKNTTGIPRTFLQLASSKDAPGAKKTPYGLYMLSKVEADAYSAPTKHDRPIWAEDEPSSSSSSSSSSSVAKFPLELTCPICHDLFRYAVRLPICGCTMCADCAMESLLDDDLQRCFVCAIPDNKPGQIIPFDLMRRTVAAFNAGTYKSKMDAIKTDSTMNSAPFPTCTTDNAVNSPIDDTAVRFYATSASGSTSPAVSTSSSTESSERPTSTSPTSPYMTTFQPVYLPAPVQPQLKRSRGFDGERGLETAMRAKGARRERELRLRESENHEVGRLREVDHYYRTRRNADRLYGSRGRHSRY